MSVFKRQQGNVLFRVLLSVIGLLLFCAAAGAAGDRYLVSPVSATAIKIDGSLTDWKTLGGEVLIDQQNLAGGSCNSTFLGPQDCQGRLRMAYDRKYLYVALAVTDNSVFPLEHKSGVPGRFWEQDGMGLYLDAPASNVASGRYNTKPTRPWAQEIILQLTPSLTNFGAETLPDGSVYACTMRKTGYTVEVAVPWESMGWQAAAGDRLFFSAILADLDRLPAGKLAPLKQYLWHMPGTEVRPASRGWAEARLMSAGGYGGELLTASPVAVQGAKVAWKMLADATQPGWQVTKVSLVGADKSTKVLETPAALIAPKQQVMVAGLVDTAALKPGVYTIVAQATKGNQTEAVQQPLQVIDPNSVLTQHKASAMPQSYMVHDPLRSGTNGGIKPPSTRPMTHEDYLAFVKAEVEAGWPQFEYHVKTKNLTLGGGWYQDYGLRYAAYAKITKDPVWIQRAQQMFEMADASYKANKYAGLGWINGPLIYYYKQYLSAVNGWKPEYDAMVKDWLLNTDLKSFPKDRNGIWYGMNNWGLCSSIRGVYGQYWLGDQMPDKDKWNKYIQEIWGDFFENVKDIDENTTNYAPWDLWVILFYLDVHGQTDRLKTDPQLRQLYERYMLETTPSGARPQYGSTNGWNDSIALYMYLFERVGQITGDGRYKAQARLMWDYSVRHVEDWHQYHLVTDQTITMLARLLAEVPDDTLAPAPVEPKSVLTQRARMIPLTPEEREKRRMWMETVPERVPGKIIFRGSNDPNSMWAMIELNNDAGHCTARPTSVNCLMDKDTVLLSSQGYYEQDPQFHNMVLVEDLEGTQGIQPEMAITVPVFQDSKLATFAVTQVDRYMRWPITLRRSFLFAKDRFMLVHDELNFKSTFFARIGPSWLSRQMGPTAGKDWVNLYFDSMPYTGLGQGSGHHKWKNNNYDLLAYFVPRQDMELNLTDMTVHNAYMNAPLRVRQMWHGLAKQGETLSFDTLLIPHTVKYQKPDASWLGNTVKTLASDNHLTAIQYEAPMHNNVNVNERVFMMLGDKPFTGDNVSTDAQAAMVVWQPVVEAGKITGWKVANWYVRQGTYLKVDGQTVFQSPEKADKEQ
ncbi:MAG: sugar-binding protein [Armatimonadota bacterium]